MKPELKTDELTYVQVIKRDYWTCYNPDHHHTTKEIAEKCIANHDRPRVHAVGMLVDAEIMRRMTKINEEKIK